MLSNNEIISLILGICSSICWLIVDVPQIVHNYTTKSVNGISPLLFILIAAGDILYLVSSIITKGELVQYITGGIFCVIDSIIIAQLLIYRSKNRSKNNENHFENHFENELELENMDNNVPKILSLAALAEMVNAMSDQRIDTISIYKNNLIGIIMEWIAVLIYFISRISQIIHNHKNKEVKDLTKWFTFGMLGNILYIASLLVISVDLQYLYNKLPWILNSALPLVCDLIILIQRFVY